MAKQKTYKIVSEQTVYSKKQGCKVVKITLEKGIETIEKAIEISKEKHGNVKGEMEWRFGGLLYPTEYQIK